MWPSGRDISFISIASKIRKKSNSGVVFKYDSSTIFQLCSNHILKQHSPGLAQIPSRHARLYLNSLEDEICCIDLTMRMRIRNTYHVALVLKNQNVIDFFAITEFNILCLPNSQ